MTRLGKQVSYYVESPIPAVYQFLPAVNRIRRRLPPAATCDAAVVLDCGDGSRVGEGWPVVSRIPVVLNIDHHVSNTGFGSHRLIEGTACATAEIVYRLIRRMGVCIDRDIATLHLHRYPHGHGVVPLREHQRRLVRHQPRDDRTRGRTP